MNDSTNETKRKVTHTKDDVFDTYVNVLMFMIENKGKSFMNSEIKRHIFRDTTDSSIKTMIKRVVDFYVGSGILVKVTNIVDNDGNEVEYIIEDGKININGKEVEVKPQQIKVRLYDKKKDGIDENGEFYEDEYIVDLHIPKSRDGKERLCQTVSSMITTIPYADIYTPTIKTVLESKLFGLQTDFVTQIIGKVILKHHYMTHSGKEDSGYPLDLIVSIIESKISVNVEFENFGNVIRLNNTKIKKITIKENGYDIHFDNFISQNQSDIKQIKLIENTSVDGLYDDVKKVRDMIDNISLENKDNIKNIIDDVFDLSNIFEF